MVMNWLLVDLVGKTNRHLSLLMFCISQLRIQIYQFHALKTNDISKAYRGIISQKGKITRFGYAYECFYCFRYFLWQDRWKKHINVCTGIPGIVYNFNNQNLVTYKDNLKYKGDIPMTISILKLLLLLIVAMTPNKRKCS